MLDNYIVMLIIIFKNYFR